MSYYLLCVINVCVSDSIRKEKWKNKRRKEDEGKKGLILTVENEDYKFVNKTNSGKWKAYDKWDLGFIIKVEKKITNL